MTTYNYKKIILKDFINYLQNKEKYTTILLLNDEEIKTLIDDFMNLYKDSKHFIKYKKFLYLTFLNKYTDVTDFFNSDRDHFWDL